MTEVSERDEQAVLRFIERFAATFAEAGLPRMPSRVFVALLAADSGSLTAAELADLLQVSPAAISGAVRYLTQISLISRERETGSRRDVYRVYDDVWYEAIFRREQMMARWKAPLQEGIDVLGAGTPAGRRIAETLAFFDFFHREMPHLLQRWRVYRDERFNS
ncbi:MarR family transcriptional regulator [Saccharothrix algeriensis]|uniref:DNA-binding transcriptional regulator GbsR (MarR family) n=1 Tax=Saccharothrix algeriensis TaxID=173560 RepID=A0A8T8I5K8_9PSEU|nr:DNA-binding transcriptional regulator GbsR (MarR family) [Saccharothrix algeriensis]QTR05921.1 MarR family transcriptional regulator [Saccharothrix algeriensis]